jgi:hypothetical protein
LRAECAKRKEGIAGTDIVAEIDHRLQPMLLNQSVDALSLVGDYRWKQLKGELSAELAQAMRIV